MSPTEPLHYDPFDATIRHDPHPVYRRLRDEAPVYFIEKYEVWALSRFDDIWRVANDTEHLTNTKGAASAQLLTKDQPAAPTINTIDPPEHTELRSQIRRAFLPRNVKALEVHARLNYRKFDQYLLNFAFGEEAGLTAPITTLSSATGTVSLARGGKQGL